MTTHEQNTVPQKTELKVHRLYTKNSLFEATTVTLALLEHPPQPIIDLQISADTYLQDKGVHEAVLTLKVTAKHQDSLLWHVHYQHAGLYTLEGFTDEVQQKILNGFCMNQLYPYACAEANRLVTQGGFYPVYLNPVNFEQLYQQQQLNKNA
jgi:preprotein translocase subunit SecB